MRILVIGSGGREHALCWKIASSPLCEKLYVAPGNAGMVGIAEILPIAVDDNQALLAAAQDLGINLTVVGPDDVLAAGLVDLFLQHGLTIFGPTQAAARLEWSKEFSKSFMERHNIPTASWRACKGAEEARAALDSFHFPLVLKTDGLALGKGVIIAANHAEAEEAIVALEKFGTSAQTLVLEEFLIGRELTLLAFCDGKRLVTMLPAEDHKQINDHDQGPNTGGMGVVIPPVWVNDALLDQIQHEIVEPTLAGLTHESIDFRGILYFGLMITADGPKVLEYNARFGDPEAQSMMLMLASDMVPILYACARGELDPAMIRWRSGAATCVVLATPGYPASSTKGLSIRGLDQLPDNVVPFFAGVRRLGDQWQTNGGRVVALTAHGETLDEALDLAYQGVAKVSFEGMQYRSDIGRRS